MRSINNAFKKEGYFCPGSEPGLSIPYTVIKSKRRTWSVSLSGKYTPTVRTPLSVSFASAEQLLSEKESWILKKYRELKKAEEKKPVSSLSPSQAKQLEARYRAAAREYFPERASYYAAIAGVTYNTIYIRDQKTRWGSCSGRGNLSFNWRLMLAPPGVLDYVVVHELCHRKEMNHSKAFWNAVEMVLPDYRTAKKWLKENGSLLSIL